MKIIKAFVVVSIVAAVIMCLSSSCAKTVSTLVTTSADSATQIIIAGDELNVNYEVDQAINEGLLATTVSEIASGNTNRASLGTDPEYNLLTNVIIDTSKITDSSLIWLTYYGKNADKIKGRSGYVILHYAHDNTGKIIPWTTAGATMTLTFDQYEVIVLSNNTSLYMNGTINLTNVSGGLLMTPAYVNLPAGDSLHDKANGAITFTYNDNVSMIVTWTWNVNHARTFYSQNSILTSLVYGDTTINATAGVCASGLNRFNDNFYTGILKPVMQTISSSYLLSNPVSGQKSIYAIPEPMQIYYGVDSTGNPVSNGNPYGYKINWVTNSIQAHTIVPYQPQ